MIAKPVVLPPKAVPPVLYWKLPFLILMWLTRDALASFEYLPMVSWFVVSWVRNKI